MATETTTRPTAMLPVHDQVVCTLYEGDYHIGVAALINSIVKEIAGDYIWHKDAFSLRLQAGKGPGMNTPF